MMNLQISESTFSFFILNELGDRRVIKDWVNVQSNYLPQLSILSELVDNGKADFHEYTCEVAVLDVLSLSDIDKQILNLPQSWPFEIHIQAEGDLGQSTFKYNFGFYNFLPDGSLLQVARKGALIIHEGDDYLLSLSHYNLCEALEIYNALPEEDKTTAFNLLNLANVKKNITDAALQLDEYLRNEIVHAPKKVKLSIEMKDGVLEITPALEENGLSAFSKRFSMMPSAKGVYSFDDDDGRKTRVVFSDDRIESLQKVKDKRRVVDKAIIEEIVEHPEFFFDEEEIDFTVFYSDRVKEIGLYKPKYYPFVCPYKSEWIPGLSIKDKIDGEDRIYLKNKSELAEFEKARNIAFSEKATTIIWQKKELPIAEADGLIQIARKQFETPEVAIDSDTEVNGCKVLIIKENAELTEYSQALPLLNKKHSFAAIDNLSAKIQLKDHQIDGVAWLQSLYINGASGCLLADDMGLGKTLQLLYFIEWHAQHHNDTKPYLIVAPVALLENWQKEYDKFFDSATLPIKLLYGSRALSKHYDKANIDELQRKQIILTNYETLKTYQLNVCAIDFAVVAIDEAQKIKTPGILITSVTKALKADFKIAMTGTPVETTLVDLWSIIDFAVPGLLGNIKDFVKEFQSPLKDTNTDLKTLGIKLREKIGVFIMRRYKSDVLKDLPDKCEYKQEQVMPLVQFEAYKKEIAKATNEQLSGVAKRNQILSSLWAIRDISDHPYLINDQISEHSTEDLIATSAKLQILAKTLRDIEAKQEKVIVFADRRNTQSMLQRVIFDSFKVFASIVNGDTPSSEQEVGRSQMSRQQTIDRFQDVKGFNVIVMSQLAAGVGLNVTGANHVIHFSRHWNPAKEQQATDRAYRIGQTKNVHVHYPMVVFPPEMSNDVGVRVKSFDQVLDDLLTARISLASNALFPTERVEVNREEMFNSVFTLNTKPEL
jgi:hypothetical protein